MATLPDQSVRELPPGEVEKYTVIRVADEITVDPMKSASGIDYAEASKDIVMRRVQDVDIPHSVCFAPPSLSHEEEHLS